MTESPDQYSFKAADGAVRVRKRRGRGNASGLGGECGRGHKGQKSRSGYSRRAGFEGGQMPLYRRLPKKPGFRNHFKTQYECVNLKDLDRCFSEGDTVDPETLVSKGLVKAGVMIKILGDGTLEKKITIKAHRFSKTALEKLSQRSSVVETLG